VYYINEVLHEAKTRYLVAQQAKPNRVKYPGLLAPLPVPEGAWQVISMDFIEGLPSSGNANCILVVVDKFSKYSHFIPLHHPFTAAIVAQTFLHNVYKLHGLPTTIISDRDKVFTSQLWQELFKAIKVQLQMSSAYHPQTDGQTERFNQCLETFLCCFVHACPKQWSKWLSLAEFGYNTNYHSSLGHSPFEVLYGHPPRQFGIQGIEQDQVKHIGPLLQERKLTQAVIKQHLLRAQARMKVQADKHRTERVPNRKLAHPTDSDLVCDCAPRAVSSPDWLHGSLVTSAAPQGAWARPVRRG
jgi:hypothetical protein